jgi:tRNA(His) 5'-end guanylyltransferase
MSKDDLGNRMKQLEQAEAGRKLMPLLPIMVRLDGKCFSKFTKGLRRPFDQRLTDLMMYTTVKLMKETNALIGYTQSDEISLVLHSDSTRSQVYFDGKVQKIVGDLAALATLEFNWKLPELIPERTERKPRFDCRVWNVPNKMEASNTILWRCLDCIKNSVSMLAQDHFSHKALHGKHQEDMLRMLHEEGVRWDAYPNCFKYGTMMKKVEIVRKFSTNEIVKLPENHAARTDPNLEILRNEIRIIDDVHPFNKHDDRVDLIFEKRKIDVESRRTMWD